MLSILKKIVLWDYRRASWQYDVIVAAILAIIFLTPQAWFHDQPRVAERSAVALAPGSYWLEAGLLSSVPEDRRQAQAQTLLRARYKDTGTVQQLQPVFNSQHQLTGYVASTGQ